MRLRDRLATRFAEVAPRGPRVEVAAPLASLCFDDFPRSAWTLGGPILARRGLHAGFYPAGSFCGRFAEGNVQFTAADLREVRDAGHEIGCHSFSHQPAPCLAVEAFATDLDLNAAFLRDAAGVEARTFAYPYGLMSGASVRVTRERFQGARRVRGGVNPGRFDPGHIAAVPLEARSWSAAATESAVARTARRGGWLVLFTHDVSEHPTPYGCTPAMLEHALETLAQAGVAVRPMAQALHGLTPSPTPADAGSGAACAHPG